MIDPGAVDENVLSALDAYVLTAAKHGILVCFNFFAFLPPSYGDTNPYLGPRALEGQRALLTMAAPPLPGRRLGPLGPHQRALLRAARGGVEATCRSATSTRPARGASGLWRSTATTRSSCATSGATAARASSACPRADEIGYNFLREDRRPRKVRDFFEFTQVAAARWAATPARRR